MQFHITITVLDSIALDDDKALRARFGPQLQRIVTSGKVEKSGVLLGKRAVFFIANVDSADDLLELLGPEVYGNFRLDVQPVTSIEKGGEFFVRWAEEGR